jgi:D-alanine-D-alanine ligase
MKQVAVLRAGSRAGRATPLGTDRGSADCRERSAGPIQIDAASEAFGGYDANYAKYGPHQIPSERNFKPNIYYKAQDFTLRAHQALGRRGVRRADFHFAEAAGDEGELVGLEVNTGPGMTETSLAPEMAVHAGLSFDEPVGWAVEDASCGR